MLKSYRIDVGLGRFALAAQIVTAVAIETLSLQSLTAARARPANMLRRE